MNFAKLPFYVFVLACFAGVCILAAIKLPEGPPRIIGAFVLIAVAVAVAAKSVRDYNRPK